MNCPEQGKHISLHGNVVNVPTNIKDTVAKLPRKFYENGTIFNEIKRKLSYKHHVTYQTLRLEKVISALEWLLENTSQYKEAGIEIDKSWNSNENIEENTIEKMTNTAKISGMKFLKRSYHVELSTLFFIHKILQQREQKFFHFHQQRGILHLIYFLTK